MPTAVEASLQDLRAEVRAGALNRPGIYRMIGSAGVVIYVGKSKRVRTRLMGYFRAKAEQKAWRIVRDAARIDWEYVPSEFASLLRELELIKLHRPPYNVRQKRDGLHCFLRLSGGSAPKLHVVRRIADDSARYFGPLLGGQRIVEAVKELNDVLMLRDCRAGIPIRFADQEDLFGSDSTPLCRRHELRLCAAPCAGGCSEMEYRTRVQEATDFLNGDAETPLVRVQQRMAAAIEHWQFELAAALRGRMERLEMLRTEFRRQQEATEGLTFLYAVPGYEGDHRIYAIRSGSIRGIYPAPKTRRERRALLKDAEKHYDRPETSADITMPRRVDQLFLVSHWFRVHPEELSSTFPAQRWGAIPLAKQMDRRAGLA